MMGVMEGLEPVADVAVAQWLAGRLGPRWGTVGAVMPSGFAAYARVLHPFQFDDGRPSMTWAQICELTGRTPHAAMQWHAITTSRAGRLSILDQGDIKVGTLVPDALRVLLDVLAPATGAQDCFHALWEGWGWVDGRGVAVFAASDDGTPVTARQPEPGVPPEVWARPRLRLPDRDYLVFRGPLRAALNMGWSPWPGWFETQSPSLLWPADRSWCVATEIDYDSTLIGGGLELIDAVLSGPGLEAWPIELDHELHESGDRLNIPR
jgi:hypothetical protein